MLRGAAVNTGKAGLGASTRAASPGVPVWTGALVWAEVVPVPLVALTALQALRASDPAASNAIPTGSSFRTDEEYPEATSNEVQDGQRVGTERNNEACCCRPGGFEPTTNGLKKLARQEPLGSCPSKSVWATRDPISGLAADRRWRLIADCEKLDAGDYVSQTSTRWSPIAPPSRSIAGPLFTLGTWRREWAALQI